MLKQKKMVFEIKDISLFTVKCGKCGGQVSQPIENSDHLPKKCPLCKELWFTAK